MTCLCTSSDSCLLDFIRTWSDDLASLILGTQCFNWLLVLCFTKLTDDLKNATFCHVSYGYTEHNRARTLVLDNIYVWYPFWNDLVFYMMHMVFDCFIHFIATYFTWCAKCLSCLLVPFFSRLMIKIMSHFLNLICHFILAIHCLNSSLTF